jgi:hypothetical protein
VHVVYPQNHQVLRDVGQNLRGEVPGHQAVVAARKRMRVSFGDVRIDFR